MSSEFQASGEPRGSADPAGAPNPAGPQGKPFSRVPPSKRSRSRPFLAGAAMVGLLGGAGLAVAASGPGTTATAAAATVSSMPSANNPGPGGMHGMGGWIPRSVQHGQIVVAKPGGGYQTIDIQSGTVTAVSTTSITVKSADGFTQSYTVTSSTIVGAQRDGIGSVKAGDQASLIATVSGRTPTAAGIIDKTLLQQSHKQFG